MKGFLEGKFSTHTPGGIYLGDDCVASIFPDWSFPPVSMTDTAPIRISLGDHYITSRETRCKSLITYLNLFPKIRDSLTVLQAIVSASSLLYVLSEDDKEAINQLLTQLNEIA